MKTFGELKVGDSLYCVWLGIFQEHKITDIKKDGAKTRMIYFGGFHFRADKESTETHGFQDIFISIDRAIEYYANLMDEENMRHSKAIRRLHEKIDSILEFKAKQK